MIDINELRRKVNSTDIVDHIDLHANIKPFLSELLDRLEAAEKERDELRAMIEAVHSILDNDESRIIRNAKDGYPEGREPKELTLTERVTALCKYAADWKRWLGESESKIKEMERQEPVAKVRVHRTGGNAGLAWSVAPLNDFDSLPLMRDGDRLYALPGAQPAPSVPEDVTPNAEITGG